MSTKAWLPVTFRFLLTLASCHCWVSNYFFLSTKSERKTATATHPGRIRPKTKEKCVTLCARPDALDVGTASFPITRCDNSEVSDWENNIRDEAATALLHVFFPFENETKKHFEGSDSKSDNLVLKPITAEIALKRLLRRKYQQVSSNNTSQHKQSHHGQNEARRRLSSLILGTGVMRLRHWYYIYFNGTVELNKERPLIIPYPLDYSILEMMNPVEAKFSFRKRSVRDDMACTPIAEETDDAIHPLMQRMKFVRAMVDEHARYLRLDSEKDGDTLGTANSSDLNATIMNLSIEYSIPPFLISSLLSQYGYTITQQICSVMNHPGPVTIRKNSIKFPSSDDEFCQWVREEDEVNAAPLARLLLKESKHETPDYINKNKQRLHPSSSSYTQGLRLVAPKDGQSNCFVMGESFKSTSEVGIIEPPAGCLQIIPRGSSGAKNPESETFSSPIMNESKSIWSMKAWKKGYFEVQDAGSQFIVQSLQVQPGDSILDYCAGNGGKTFGLASAIRTQCLFSNSSQASYIVAHDVVDERLRQVKGSMSRVGFVPNGSGDSSDRDVYAAERGNITIEIMNSSNLEASCLEFDAVLVDAPCSSSGVLRRRPSQRWEITQEGVFGQLPYLQLNILEKAASYVRKGGRLIYSTCSILKAENEGVVDEFERTRAFSNLGFSRWDFGLDEANVKNNTCHYAHMKHTVTILPTENGNDGFFVARWIKQK